MKSKINVLMCGSDLSVKGGMVSVVKNYLNYNNWGRYRIIYVPTHIEKNKLFVALYFAKAYLKIIYILLTQNVEIAHLHTAERGSFFRKAILVRTFKKFGVKTIMHHHAAEFEQFYHELSSKKKLYVNKTLYLTDLNLVLSNRLVSTITKKSLNAKVKVLYNAVETYDKNPYNKSANNVLFLGRLGKRKGTFDLLKAIKKINQEIPKETQFYLCGDGEIREVKKKVAEYGLEDRIAYVGWIEKERKLDFFNNSCINVLPSYNEGLPMSILETMAYGIPNITTAIASIPEVVKDGQNGNLIKPGDIDGLARYLKELLLSHEKRESYSEKAYSLITKEFSLDNHILRLICYYDELIGEKND